MEHEEEAADDDVGGGGDGERKKAGRKKINEDERNQQRIELERQRAGLVEGDINRTENRKLCEFKFGRANKQINK